jgi:hypothetical protein
METGFVGDCQPEWVATAICCFFSISLLGLQSLFTLDILAVSDAG